MLVNFNRKEEKSLISLVSRYVTQDKKWCKHGKEKEESEGSTGERRVRRLGSFNWTGRGCLEND